MSYFEVKTPYLDPPQLYDHKKRIPRLRIEIVNLLVVEANLSKTKAWKKIKRKSTPKHPRENYDYGDIADAFDTLLSNDIIIESCRMKRRGKDEVYYKITEKGLASFICSDPKIVGHIGPEKFWKAILMFCLNNDKQVTLDQVEYFYRLFIRRYLTYPGYGYPFQLDSFNKVCKDWLEDMVMGSNKLTSYQKVLEALALSTDIPLTAEELVQETGESYEEIHEVLSRYTSYENINDGSYGDKDSTFYFQRLIKLGHGTHKNNSYELSVFGVILVLTLVRYQDMGLLKHGLYYTSIGFEEFYDKVALNYHDKLLPLIFGRWHKSLKRILKPIPAYNIDILLDKEKRSIAMDKTVLMKGNGELYTSMRLVASYSLSQLTELYKTGLLELYNYRKYDKTVAALIEKLIDISLLFVRSGKKELLDCDKETEVYNISIQQLAQRKRPSDEKTMIEKAFEEEITSVYFLSLWFNNTESLFSGKTDLLKMVLEHNPQIKEWFSGWFHSLEKYQEDASKVMKERYKEIIIEK